MACIWPGQCSSSPSVNTTARYSLLFYFFTLVTGPGRFLGLRLSDARVYEPQLRARLGARYRLSAKREQLKRFQALLRESHGQNLALTVLHVPWHNGQLQLKPRKPKNNTLLAQEGIEKQPPPGPSLNPLRVRTAGRNKN